MTTQNTRNKVISELELRLGGGMVDVELDPDHYNVAIDKALDKFRQRSENAVEESFVALPLKTDVSVYTLPNEIIEVFKIYRRSTGVSSSSGNDFEPFESQYLNSYLMNSGRAGGLATYDALAQHRETLGRLFGAEMMFTWNHTKHTLIVHRKVRSDDDVFMHVYNYRPETELFEDTYAKPWLKDYALAQCKMMLAEARGKFATLAGPQGGTTMNADQLKNDAMSELEKLELDLLNFRDGSSGYGFIIG